jgi:arylsulfatase A-like enzyme
MGQKTGFFDQSFHIPLIIRDPRPQADVTRGTAVSSFSENIDLMPTILDWAGAQIPGSCDGFSLLPFLVAEHGLVDDVPTAPTWWRQHAVSQTSAACKQ